LAVTIHDIAKRAGVSVSTVSRVMNGKPDVRQATQDKVNAAIKELKYRPNTVARGLVLQRSNVIGFIASDITNPNFPGMARGVVARAREYGYSVMIFDTFRDSEVEKEAINLLRSRQVDGIILNFGEVNTDELEKLKKEKFPVVQVYRKTPRSAISTIAIDNVESGYNAVSYLLNLGHRRIGHITPGVKTQSGIERLEGYRKALKEREIPFEEELVIQGNNTSDSGRECMEQLLALDNPPTAVFAAHDMMALGAYDAVFSAGLSIPEDISVVGHDNIPVASLVRPKLTTVDTAKGELGKAGIDLLIREIENEAPISEEKVFSTELLIRESCRSLKD
jgi:LacI family transcriptional regulator